MTIQKIKTYLNLILFAVLIMFTSCDFFDDEPKDKEVIVTLFVSAQTGSMTGMTGIAHECMLVKQKGKDSWETWPFEGIIGFTYEKGYDYELLVRKTIYANPPADGHSYSFELIQVISKVLPNIP